MSGTTFEEKIAQFGEEKIAQFGSILDVSRFCVTQDENFAEKTRCAKAAYEAETKITMRTKTKRNRSR
jgi:hypothetical protein